MYCYLCRKGCDNEKAKDLTQGFFQEVVLDRDLIQQADREKGKFRTFLLTALDRYAANIHRAESAKKRMPTGGLVHLDAMESWIPPESDQAGRPDEMFVYAWASELLDEVLASVKAICKEAGQEKHWGVFHRTVIEPADGAETPPLSQICKDIGIENETKASNMCITVKRRFKATLKVRIRQFVDSDGQVDEEIRDLMQILSKSGAGK